MSEGASVLVISKKRARASLTRIATRLAAVQYPSVRLTGRMLYTGLDEFGHDQHEVVLEVKP